MADLLERNVAVGFGTDSPVASGAFDLLAEARLAMLLSAGDSDSEDGAGAISAAEALNAATLGGAVALGLGSTCGSIEAGKAADLVCVDLASLACQSFGSAAEAVLFGATRRDISDVWTGGRAAVSESRLLAYDEQELLGLARRWGDRIQSGTAE